MNSITVKEEEGEEEREPIVVDKKDVIVEMKPEVESEEEEEESCGSDLNDWLEEEEEEEEENEPIVTIEEEEPEPLNEYLSKHKPLYDVMLQVPLFSNLSQNQQQDVMKSLKSVTFQDGECVVKQGDRGNKFYMIVKGEAVVTKMVPGQEMEIMLTHLYAGHYFGELALLYDDKRTATVRAVGNDVELMYLSRKDFEKVSFVQVSLLLKQVPILKELNRRDQDAVLTRLKHATFRNNEYIVRQGEEGDRFYIITHGEAVITETDPMTKVQKELTRLYAGHTFGEMSLIYDEPRSASVQAVGRVNCMYLTKTDFRESLKSERFHEYIQKTYIEKATTRALRRRSKRPSDKRPSYEEGENALETRKLVKLRLPNGSKVVNKYVIKGDIGRGQFGRVQLAQNEEDGKFYAIKIMSKTLASYLSKREDQFETALRQETAIMKKLHHPNVVRLIEVIDDPSSQKIYLVQEYVEGGNLMEVLAKDHPIGDVRARKFMHCILRGIDYLHFQKVIHRDIKPENLLVTTHDVVKIADFGAAEMFRHESETFNDAKGTPAFMAPELFDDDVSYVGPAVDIWSLGATLFMMVTGHPPWNADNEIELSNKIQRDELVFPDDQPIGPHLQNLLRRMLTKDPKRRITLDQVMEHAWITREGSEPVELQQYDESDQVTVSCQESEAAIWNLPTQIDPDLREKLERANLLVKDVVMKRTTSSSSASSAGSLDIDGKHIISSWRFHKRTNLILEHEGLSDRSKNMLIDQKRVALSADRADATELIMTSSKGNVLEGVEWIQSPYDTLQRSSSDTSLPSPTAGPKPRQKRLGSIPGRTLERKKDFLMVTSEVLPSGPGGGYQTRKVVFQAKGDDFSVASNMLLGSSKNVLKAGRSLHSLTEEDLEEESSDDDELGSDYSDMDESAELSEMLEELIQSPRTESQGERNDPEFAPIESENVIQVTASSRRENLSLGIRFGSAEAQGSRPTMEDRSTCLSNHHGKAYLAVYDGHNGSNTSNTLQDRLHDVIICTETLPMTTKLIHDGFLSMDEEILQVDRKRMDIERSETTAGLVPPSFSGATAVIAIVDQSDTVYIANVGDSRAVLCSGALAVDLTIDHKADESKERQRIEQAGGFVHNGRLNGVLAISRAFGDIMHKTGQQFIATPDVTCHKVSEQDEFIILASDGLFDGITSQQAVNFVRQKMKKHGDVQLAAQELVMKGLDLFGHDNITAVILCLNQS